MHGPSLLCLTLALLIALHVRRSGAWCYALGATLSLAYFVRPTNIVPVLAFAGAIGGAGGGLILGDGRKMRRRRGQDRRAEELRFGHEAHQPALVVVPETVPMTRPSCDPPEQYDSSSVLPAIPFVSA